MSSRHEAARAAYALCLMDSVKVLHRTKEAAGDVAAAAMSGCGHLRQGMVASLIDGGASPDFARDLVRSYDQKSRDFATALTVKYRAQEAAK